MSHLSNKVIFNIYSSFERETQRKGINEKQNTIYISNQEGVADIRNKSTKLKKKKKQTSMKKTRNTFYAEMSPKPKIFQDIKLLSKQKIAVSGSCCIVLIICFHWK